MRIKYVPFFDHTKLTETFSSQKDIYDLVEDINTKITSIITQAVKNFAENKDKETRSYNYYYIYFNSLQEFVCQFNIQTLLAQLSHRNGVYIDLINFYEDRPYAFLEIHAKASESLTHASYETRGKGINITLRKNFDKFVQRVGEENYKMAVNLLFYENDFENDLIHEMTHLYDDMVSKEKSITRKASSYVSAEKDIIAYIQNPIEINARFYEAVFQNAYHKLEICTSDKALKYQWIRKYKDSVASLIGVSYLTKDQQEKIYKRMWVEFTTFSKKETDLLSFISKKTILANGSTSKIDVRIVNKRNVIDSLKKDFIALSKGHISKTLFSKKEPFENDELNSNIASESEYRRKLDRQILWEEAYYFNTFCILISKYGIDDYSTKLIDTVIKQLRLNTSTVSEIKSQYGSA